MQTVCDNLVTGVQAMTVHPDLLPLAHNSSLYPSADEHPAYIAINLDGLWETPDDFKR